MERLLEALAEVEDSLERIGLPHVVVGGIAASFWGEPRYTSDADVLVAIEPEQIESFLDEFTRLFIVTRGPEAPRDFLEREGFLRMSTRKGVLFDILRADHPYLRNAVNRGHVCELEGRGFALCSPEDLILMKVISDRHKDQNDVREIVFKQWRHLDKNHIETVLKSLADMFEEDSIIRVWEEIKAEVESVLGPSDA